MPGSARSSAASAEADGAVATRHQRRRRATETRLLDAALRVFCARGYDAATTAEMARAAGVAAGTFYVHFRDKRAAYEQLARRAAQDLLARWRTAMRPRMAVADRVATGLRLAATYWRADPARARLLLEGGPSFGTQGHLRFVDEIASVLTTGRSSAATTSAHAVALMTAALGIELGRLIVARPEAKAEADALIRLARHAIT